MVGRAAYQDPGLLTRVDGRLFGESVAARPAEEVVRTYLPYVSARLAAGERLSRMVRHLVGLFQGRAGARRWRQHLSVAGSRPGAGVEVVEDALALVAPAGPRAAAG